MVFLGMTFSPVKPAAFTRMKITLNGVVSATGMARLSGTTMVTVPPYVITPEHKLLSVAIRELHEGKINGPRHCHPNEFDLPSMWLYSSPRYPPQLLTGLSHMCQLWY